MWIELNPTTSKQSLIIVDIHVMSKYWLIVLVLVRSKAYICVSA